MKLLCTLLAFLVLTLSVQPVCAAASCAETESCCSGGEECTGDMQHEDDGGHNCKGGCNPFQVCACCAAAVVLPGVLVVFAEPLPQPPSVSWGVFSPQAPLWPAYAIWQPPKIG